MRARIFDIRIWNPGKHFASLSEHLLSCGIEVSVHLDRNAGATNQRRNGLHNLLVFIQLLSGTEPVAGRNQRPNFWVSRDERWIGRLAVYVADKAFYSNRLFRIATVH